MKTDYLYFRVVTKITRHIVLALLLCLISPVLQSHPFHVSVAQVRYNQQNQSLEIAIKLFTDDLENALTASFGNQGWNLATPKQLPAADQYIRKYLKPRFALTQKSQSLNWNWIGAEYNMDAVWCYLELYNFDKNAGFEWKNTVFLEIFSDQKNIGHFEINNEKISVYTSRHKREQKIGIQ